MFKILFLFLFLFDSLFSAHLLIPQSAPFVSTGVKVVLPNPYVLGYIFKIPRDGNFYKVDYIKSSKSGYYANSPNDYKYKMGALFLNHSGDVLSSSPNLMYYYYFVAKESDDTISKDFYAYYYFRAVRLSSTCPDGGSYLALESGGYTCDRTCEDVEAYTKKDGSCSDVKICEDGGKALFDSCDRSCEDLGQITSFVDTDNYIFTPKVKTCVPKVDCNEYQNSCILKCGSVSNIADFFCGDDVFSSKKCICKIFDINESLTTPDNFISDNNISIPDINLTNPNISNIDFNSSNMQNKENVPIPNINYEDDENLSESILDGVPDSDNILTNSILKQLDDNLKLSNNAQNEKLGDISIETKQINDNLVNIGDKLDEIRDVVTDDYKIHKNDYDSVNSLAKGVNQNILFKINDDKSVLNDSFGLIDDFMSIPSDLVNSISVIKSTFNDGFDYTPISKVSIPVNCLTIQVFDISFSLDFCSYIKGLAPIIVIIIQLIMVILSIKIIILALRSID
jgi:hypothetical protein